MRGVYAKTDLPEGHILSDEDVYLAIPLQKAQISSRPWSYETYFRSFSILSRRAFSF